MWYIELTGKHNLRDIHIFYWNWFDQNYKSLSNDKDNFSLETEWLKLSKFLMFIFILISLSGYFFFNCSWVTNNSSTSSKWTLLLFITSKLNCTIQQYLKIQLISFRFLFKNVTLTNLMAQNITLTALNYFTDWKLWVGELGQ